MKFKVGDRVRGVSADIEGCEGTIVSVDMQGYGIALTSLGNKTWHGKNEWVIGAIIKRNTFWNNNLKLIGGHMSKYDELKERIGNVIAWDKDADDAREEICRKSCYGIRLHNYPGQNGGFCIFDTMISNIRADSNRCAVMRFEFNSQCGKLTAFKQALTWLLDHSDIKKDLCGTEQKVEIEGKVYKARILEKA